jgi:hypothetical protein
VFVTGQKAKNEGGIKSEFLFLTTIVGMENLD